MDVDEVEKKQLQIQSISPKQEIIFPFNGTSLPSLFEVVI